MSKSLGLRVKQIREKLELTQEKFSILLGGIPRENLSKIESGKIPLPKKAELEIVSSLGVPREWLHEGIGELTFGSDVVLPGNDIPEGKEPELSVSGITIVSQGKEYVSSDIYISELKERIEALERENKLLRKTIELSEELNSIKDKEFEELKKQQKKEATAKH